MPKIVVNLYLALLLTLDFKIQDTGKETEMLHYVKIFWCTTILLPSHDIPAAQGLLTKKRVANYSATWMNYKNQTIRTNTVI